MIPVSVKLTGTAASLVLAAAVWAAVAQLRPTVGRRGLGGPEPTLERLGRHLQTIARAPRPPGTPHHARTRDYIVTTLRGHGLEPRIQKATMFQEMPAQVRVADVQNVLARIPGTDPRARAILVASHYDTTPISRGAADDGAGVAAMLELARLLRAGPAQPNPVVLLFSDGEERGLLGARAFASADPLAAEIGVVINLEARGSGGPPVLIETSGAAASLLDVLRASEAPVWASSLVPAAYRRSGNDTDFTVFREAGWPGYNLAFFDRSASYHTVRDSVEAIDPNSLLAQARAAHRLTVQLRATPLGPLKGSADAVYASLPLGFLHYRTTWALPLALLALGLGWSLALRGRRDLSLREVARSAALVIGAVGLAAAAATGVQSLWSAWLGPSLVRWEQRDGFLLASLLAVAGVLLGCLSWWPERAIRRELLLAYLTLLASMAGALALALPGASYLFALPALTACLALAVSRRSRTAPLNVGLRVLVWTPAVFLTAQVVVLLAMGLGLRAGLAILALSALLMVPLVALAIELMRRARWILTGGLLLASLGSYLLAARSARIDRENPATNHLVLAVDNDRGAAIWASTDPRTDEWTASLLKNPQRGNLAPFFGGRDTPVWSAGTALPAWPGSRIERISDKNREVELRLVPARGSSTVRLDVHSSAALEGVSVAGRPLEPAARPAPGPLASKFALVYYNPPASGVPISLTLARPGTIELVVVDTRHGALEAWLPARPAHLIPTPELPTDCGLVRQTFRFDSRAIPGE